MFDPSTVQGIGTVVQVLGILNKSSSESEAARFNAAVADQNAGLALAQGEADVVQQRRLGELRMGRIRSGYGASGIRSDSGSALDVLEDSAAQAKLDEQNIRYGAMLRARGFNISADLDRRRASSASSGGLFSAAGAALLGYARMQQMEKSTPGTGSTIPYYTGTGVQGDYQYG